MIENAISLSELNQQIKFTLSETFDNAFWVIAEISQVSINRNGHCYLELIEKDEKTNKLTAKSRATIWNYTFQMLKPYFESATGLEFDTELKIMVKAHVSFHELYGLSLNILDIDPTYTLGDLARKRQEIIEQLKDEGVFEMNKELKMPAITQKIAVISSETAAGFGDFMNQLENNSFGFAFEVKLFQATMQGEKAEMSIIQALERIFEHIDFFDVVVIIRGGGAKSDLSCFDSYDLAYFVTQFPKPVITGIGHERDESILDMVAHTQLKTPTAVAEFLINRLADFENRLFELQNSFTSFVQRYISQKALTINHLAAQSKPIVSGSLKQKNNKLSNLMQRFHYSTKMYVANQEARLQSQVSDYRYQTWNYLSNKKRDSELVKQKMKLSLAHYLNKQNNRLELFQKSIQYLSPEKILKRGFSITLQDGNIIKNAADVVKNKPIETRLFDGLIKSTVDEIQSKREKK